MATIILICGLPGSGKTTLANQLARVRPALRLGEDDWMVQLFASPDGHGEDQREAIKRVQWAIATNVALLGIDVVLDWGFWSRRERDDYRARAATLDIPTELRFLDVPRDELIRRLAVRDADRPPATFAVAEADLNRWWDAFERPGADELNPP
ncbi:MAG TPA: ATP-binding protein [Thermomicrobiales bacterium]|nr:ATP-binding protein [Thermomicrobiales bacterium]